MIFCRTETRKNRAGEQKPRQKSQKKQQGHKKSYRNRKIRYWNTEKLTGKEKRATGIIFPTGFPQVQCLPGVLPKLF
jgi:hypothetical protein